MDSEEGWTNGHPPPLKPIEECFRIAATPPLFLHYDREDGNHCELFVIQDEEAIHFPVQSALLSIWPRAFSNLESVMFRGMWFYWADLRHSFSTVMSTVKHIIFLDVNLSGWPFEMSRAEALGRVPLLPNLGPDQSMQRILEKHIEWWEIALALRQSSSLQGVCFRRISSGPLWELTDTCALDWLENFALNGRGNELT